MIVQDEAYFGASGLVRGRRALRLDKSVALLQRLMVPGTGLEPARLAAHGPKPCASANSAIRAWDQYKATSFELMAALKFIPADSASRILECFPESVLI
jgi:hypothetical protein